MVGKDSKPKQKVDLKTTQPVKISMNIEQWEKSMENEKRSRTIQGYLGFDILLRDIIKRNFPERTKEVKKLMNSSNMNMIQKARLAYILGLINKTILNNLEQIHEIRNEFGHSFEASFANAKVLKFVRKLSTAKGQEITEYNSYDFYERAISFCIGYFTPSDKNV